jgi:hypothetical protein
MGKLIYYQNVFFFFNFLIIQLNLVKDGIFTCLHSVIVWVVYKKCVVFFQCDFLVDVHYTITAYLKHYSDSARIIINIF